MLNIAVVEEWANDLERGRWQQGVSRLRPTPDTYCCLGCLSEVAQPRIGGEWLEARVGEGDEHEGEYYDWDSGEWVEDPSYEPEYEYLWVGVQPPMAEYWQFRDGEELTQDVARFVGIGQAGTFQLATDAHGGDPEFAPIVIDGATYYSLADANDKGCTFPQIAGVLREWIAIAKERGLAA